MTPNNFMKLKTVLSAILLITAGACSTKEGEVVAEVGKERIYQDEFLANLKLRRIEPNDSDLVSRALDEYLQNEALAQAVGNTDILDSKLIEAEINEFRKQLLVNRYFETFLNDKASEEAIRNYYNSHKEDYASAKVHVAHILVRNRASSSEVEKAAKLTRIREAHAKLLSGMSFEDAADTYSEDKRSAVKGGDLGWVSSDAINQNFAKAAFSMGVGEISEPIESDLGYHIIKVIEAPVESFEPFEKVKGDIRYQLRQAAKQAEMERLLSSVKVERVEP